MHRYIALDTHTHTCLLVVMGSRGERLHRQIVETNGSALIPVIRGIPRPRHLVFEEGTQSSWLYELLKPEVDECVVAIPEKRKNESKADEADAWDLAEKLRTNAVKRKVFKGQGVFGPLRDSVRGHSMVTRDLVRVKNRLKAVYRSRGLHGMGTEVYTPGERGAWLRQLPGGHRELADMLGRECDCLEALREEAEERLLQEARKHPITAKLITAPAIGPIRAAHIVAIVMTPHRFRTKHQFWQYCGLGVTTTVSAQWKVDANGKFVRAKEPMPRGLNRNHNPALKEIFKGAAHQIACNMTSHPLHYEYQRMVREGTKPEIAQVNLARHISAAVLSMWKHGEVYDQARVRTQKA